MTPLEIIIKTQTHLDKGGKIVIPADQELPIGYTFRWDYEYNSPISGSKKKQKAHVIMHVIAGSSLIEYISEFNKCFGTVPEEPIEKFFYVVESMDARRR